MGCNNIRLFHINLYIKGDNCPYCFPTLAALTMGKFSTCCIQPTVICQVSDKEGELMPFSTNKLVLLTCWSLPCTKKYLWDFLGEVKIYEILLDYQMTRRNKQLKEQILTNNKEKKVIFWTSNWKIIFSVVQKVLKKLLMAVLFLQLEHLPHCHECLYLSANKNRSNIIFWFKGGGCQSG